MFLKSLIISKGNEVIREINFRKGLNLIVDESSNQITGNDVGKTTTLKLIDFCLGADAKNIYLDNESKKNEHTLVKEYLVENKILITLILKQDLDNEDSEEIKIERNFLSRKEAIRRVNEQDILDKDFEDELERIIFPEHKANKPTFRQIISHNIRYDDDKIAHTIKTLGAYASDAEYETLHLFLLGCKFEKGNRKQELLTKINQETVFKNRFEKKQTRTAYETSLALIENDIVKLNKKKTNLNLNENFEKDLENLNNAKYNISKISAEISRLTIRRNIILEAKQELADSISKIDVKQLEIIYQQASNHIGNLQKSFEELLTYHNQMIIEKVKFITQELPDIEESINKKNQELRDLLKEESKLATKISKSDSYEDLEKIITELNDKFRKKGEFENIIQQIKEVENEINNLNLELGGIDKDLFSNDFEKVIILKNNKFNQYFSSVSDELYGEQYALSYNITQNKKGQKLYKFSTFDINNPNMSSGKKQGEISCFDIAYTEFADDENIPCLHFILNDKKELMDDKQLVKIGELINKKNMQFVASILKDKLPSELNREEYFVLKLSREDKLFRIENSSKEKDV